MAKLTEKMLYSTYLDLYYAKVDYESMIEDLTDSLKNIKSNYKKTIKLLGVAKEHYIKVSGHEPMDPKK